MIGLDEYVKVCADENFYSPDIPAITQRFSRVAVFIYGTEKFAFSEHDVLKNWPRVGIGHTTLPQYSLYTTKDAEPVAFYEPMKQSSYRLQGEIYLIPPWLLFELDARFQNTVFHQRRMINAIYLEPADRDKKDKIFYSSMVFCYFGKPEMWFTRDKKLDPCRVFKPQDKTVTPYYAFTPLNDRPNVNAINRMRTRM